MGYVVWTPPQEPGSWISEGDTSAFLTLVDNGLRSHEHPGYGGWGGRLAQNPSDPSEWSRTGVADRDCEDGAHLARAFRQESLEEVAAGSAARSAAKGKPDPQAMLIERLLPLVEFERPPANVVEARPVFRELVTRHPSTWLGGLFMTLVWTLVVNVVGEGGIEPIDARPLRSDPPECGATRRAATGPGRQPRRSRWGADGDRGRAQTS